MSFDGWSFDGQLWIYEDPPTVEAAGAIDANIGLISSFMASVNGVVDALGTMANQDSNAVNISGGTITNITDLAIADGGTGASTAGDARDNLGLRIGSEVQAQSAVLQAIADAAPGAGVMLVGTGSTWGTQVGASLRTSIGVGTANNVQFATLGLGGVPVAGYPLTAYQAADNQGWKLFGFDDKSTNALEMYIDPNGYGVFYTAGLMALRAQSDWRLETGGKYYFRDMDASYATRLTIDSAASPAVGRVVIAENSDKTFVMGAGNQLGIGFDGTDGVWGNTLKVTGDTFWTGDGSGVPYGHMYTNTTITVAISDNNPTEIQTAGTDFTTGKVNLVTFSDHYLQVDKAGTYAAMWSISCAQNSPSAAINAECGVMINGVAEAGGKSMRVLPNASDVGASAAPTILDLNAGDQVSLYITNETNTTDLDILHANLVIWMLGGT